MLRPLLQTAGSTSQPSIPSTWTERSIHPFVSFIEAHSDPTHNPLMSCTVNMSQSGQHWWISKAAALYHECTVTGSRKCLSFVNCVVKWPWTTTAGMHGMALACLVWWSFALGTVYSLQEGETHTGAHNYKNTTGCMGDLNCIYIRYTKHCVFPDRCYLWLRGSSLSASNVNHEWTRKELNFDAQGSLMHEDTSKHHRFIYFCVLC